MSNKEQVEQIKQELALFLRLSERLEFPKEEVEKQINLYPDELKKLMDEEEN